MIEQSIILAQIIFIDIILAADNAVIIGLIAANFVPKNRKQIILWGVAGALVFKIIFALFATYLFEFYFIPRSFLPELTLLIKMVRGKKVMMINCI